MAKISSKKKKPKATSRIQNVGFKMETCAMYRCLRRMMRLTRWFGLFPVEGLHSTSISELRFNMKSFYGFYVLFTCFGQCSMTVISFWALVTDEFSLGNLSHFIFYASSFASTVVLVILAKNWPILMKEIANIEREVIVKLGRNTSLLIFRMNLFILLSGLVEHILCYIYVMNFAMKCLKVSTINLNVLEMLLTLKLTMLVNDQQPDAFHVYTGALFEFSNAQAVFIWNLVDVFVINHSIYLGAYFIALNKLIATEKSNISADWGLLRLQYARLVILVKKIDTHLNFFVMISFLTNLFFTILQLFNSLRIQKYEYGFCDYEGAIQAVTGTIHSIYYGFSFVHLIVRTVLVSLLTANVNTHASQPISALGEVHASMYSSEIQRFYRQITYTTIGVSGIFFYVTRQMILKVLGTLITYELVLLQFTGISVDNQTNTNTTDRDSSKRFTFNF